MFPPPALDGRGITFIGGNMISPGISKVGAVLKVKCKKCGYIVYHRGKTEIESKCKKCGSTDCVIEDLGGVVIK